MDSVLTHMLLSVVDSAVLVYESIPNKLFTGREMKKDWRGPKKSAWKKASCISNYPRLSGCCVS